MLSEKTLNGIVNKYKRNIAKEVKNGNYEIALEIISIVSSVLYETNSCYTDNELEKELQDIALRLKINTLNDGLVDKILFFDGFGLNNRGLAKVYLEGLVINKPVVYVTYSDRKHSIADILQILSKTNSEIYFINRKKDNYVSQINQFNEIIKKSKPNSLFYYSKPEDVVGVTILNMYKGIIKRFLINLTDHTFWLGAQSIDYCIEFRDYGANVSKYYRGIDDSRIVKLPYYPFINKALSFEGYPFEYNDKSLIIFSGGALYKTFGANGTFYKMVEHFLKHYDNTIFWYAGNGDSSELNKLMAQYQNRVFFTEERRDLFQLLEKCDVYLSTYPIYGALMIQYSAAAGLVPLTLKQDNRLDDILIGNENLKYGFWTMEDLYCEAHKLLTDKSYRNTRREIMCHSVITPEQFNNNLNQLLASETTEYSISYDRKNINKIGFRGIKHKEIDIIIFNSRSPLKYFAHEYIRGGIYYLGRRIKKYIHSKL